MYQTREQLTSNFDDYEAGTRNAFGITNEQNVASGGRPLQLVDADDLFSQIVAQYGEQPTANTIMAGIAAESFQNSAHIGPVEGTHNPIHIETPEERENRLAMELWGGGTTEATESKGGLAFDLADSAATLNEQFGIAA